jgi:mono/diheme cytochrome c family protein
MSPSRLVPLAFVLATSALPARAVDYVREVKPILVAHCYACHGALQQKAGLRLDTVALMKAGGDNGPVVVAGKSADSPLFRHVSATGRTRMPPASEGDPLKKEDVAALRSWIDEGAIGPAGEKPEADPKDHWAFRPAVRPALPRVKNPAWVGNPLDAFIAAEQDRRGLVPQKPADKRILLRRVTLDLIGLPPTDEEVAAFLSDDSPRAYEKVVERLLSSPHHGERWGRHWMDVWRYSDWWGLGAEVRNSQKHIWHWRDWIVESVNADAGYDQMVREMLAADELYPTDAAKLRGTGFLARSYFKFNRNTWMEEVVEHTSKAFLGLTVNCAKCHDHKYDPIAQEDFYRFRAFFEPYQVRTDLTNGEIDFEKDGVPRAFDCNLSTPTFLFVRGDEKKPRKKPILPGMPAVLGGKLDIRPIALPSAAHSPGASPVVLDAYLRQAESQIQMARVSLAKAKKVLAEREVAKKTPAKPVEKGPLVRDDFAKTRPDLWEMKTGRWLYKGGKLVQEQDESRRAVLRLKTPPPVDFQARFRFTPVGGKVYKSVGLSFDVAEGNEILVYLSAFAEGPKLQIAFKQGADYAYPGDGSQARPVKLNEAQDLVVRVRGPIVNVEVNGKHALAYRLAAPRKEGSIELIAFDARAELTAFELSALPPEAALVSPGTVVGVASVGTSLEKARLAVAVAEKALAVALLRPAALSASAAADRGRTPSLAREANLAERRIAVASAEATLARFELEAEAAPTKLKSAALSKVATARMGLEKARKLLDAPGETYASLRGSLKTLESNTESEASRNKPFPTTSSGRRSALARWMTDADNPLTARVAVNHIWLRHFGKPLVPTVFDFGRKGTPPTHPELLDWLAVELRESGWSMKHIHRLIVTSNTYRMTSSGANAPANRALDPENRAYWRMNSVRMESQAIRDSLLSLAGDLDPSMGGPPVPVNAATSRRSLYFVHSHNDQQKFLSIFDDANVLECYRRAESILPQQALALQNSRLAMGAAEKIAARLDTPERAADAAFVRASFETILGQTPTGEEQSECVAALRELRTLADKEKRPDPARHARTALVHALLNHNDFVTIR